MLEDTGKRAETREQDGSKETGLRVSVAMCTYNGERFLAEQLRTISYQTRLPYELIICDDGSSDATREIIEIFSKSSPFPVHCFVNETNLGSTKNFERAIRCCTGDAIALCDQDDLWRADKLECLAAILEQDAAIGGVFSDATLINEDGTRVGESLWQRAEFSRKTQRQFSTDRAAFLMIERAVVTGATFIFRTKFREELLPIPSEWIHDRWIATLLAAISRLAPVPEELISYRLHATQQIGVTRTPWQGHLHTEKEKAIAFHLGLARQISLLADKLASLPADQKITRYARREIRFLEMRGRSLQKSRLIRFFRVSGFIPDYFRFGKGMVSYLRDLLHD